jgi:RNA polymerase sigma-70 factor, ECF subfamily
MIQDKEIENKTDEELVALTLTSQAYYSCLIRRYEEKLARYIRRISSFSREDVEDILQEVFIKAYLNIRSFDPKLRFSSWIYRITHNQVVSHWRKTKSKPSVISAEENNSWLESIPDKLDIEKELNIKFDAEEVKKVLSKMDDKYREVLVLRFLEGKDYIEISDILEKPMGTVATLINRAKKKFQENFEQHRVNNLNFHN